MSQSNTSGTSGERDAEFIERLEALKQLVAEAEDTLVDFAIDMRIGAKNARLRADELAAELGE